MYESMSTVELRALVRERGLAKGAAVASARKEDLIGLLEGTIATIDTPTLNDAANGIRAALTPVSQGTGDSLADVIAAAISGKVKSGVDAGAVEAIARDVAAETLATWVDEALPGIIAAAMPKSAGITINMPELPGAITFEGEPLHAQYMQVLTWLRADVPVWLGGQPGSGKTHMGRQLARAMGIEPYIMAIDETTTANKLLGFQNLVSGDFVPGWLYEPFKAGGLVVIDEIDTGNPGIIAGLNALLSNGHYLFPNGETVEKHPMFRVLACANTNGTGAVAGFTARQRLDAATLNRFACIKLGYDESLELAITCGIPQETAQWTPGEPADMAACEAWVRWVQAVRALVGDNVLVSPRPSVLGVRALRAGVPADQVADALVFALCAADTVTTIKRRCGEPVDVVHAARKVA